jgi:hypothetical protein
MIREAIVTTQDPTGRVHIAPIGLIEEDEGLVIAPFRPSTTLENLQHNPFAVANYTDDVLVFAGCLTGRRDWPTRPAAKVPGAVRAHPCRAGGCAGHRGCAAAALSLPRRA